MPVSSWSRRTDLGAGGNPLARWWRAILVAPWIVVAAQAFTVIAPTFHQLVDDADEILRVRVTDVSCAWEEKGGRRTIVTLVECGVLKTMKGAERPSITLKMLGGQMGEAKLTVPDMPKLEVGERYVIFVKNNGRAMCPLLAAMHGSYRLEADENSGAERVMRSDGTALRATADVSRTHEPDGNGAKALTGPELTREEFEAAIFERVRDARAK